ncbi:putative chitin deacetylase [Talaromyces proteolyticus]|uniref:Chitin deacetylase n=1 Tax=Talaromyces proteolyticus TaxID=1131652 RepID=A0AAD4KTN4_9EURO|nr:putative chitin deacetylase [Talaromyces proteolyticus]KAH8696341.1 putative chitin deacetylase [Talaromyces proteolyticus]
MPFLLHHPPGLVLESLQRETSTKRIPASEIAEESSNVQLVTARIRFGERCGPDVGYCDEDLCCSPAGYCGNTTAHCQAPDCQLDYGSCDANKTPQGLSTEDIPRPHVGYVPYGQEVYSCQAPYTFAMTFDDGPNQYTSDLLDILEAFNAKATFFITGVNSGKGQIDDFGRPWGKLIQRMHHGGHQIASHTWSHQDLNTITPSQRRDQLVKNEAALRNILGGFPTYMRPPYSNCDDDCLDDLAELGYHVIFFNIDTNDYKNDNPEAIQLSKDTVGDALSNSQVPLGRPFLAIGHDIHAQTVYNLTSYILRRVQDAGYRAVTVGECLNDPRDNWYRWDYRTQ